jgi:hypothetical protein
MRPVVEALMTLRGIDLVAAMTLVAEIGDIRRFTHPRELQMPKNKVCVAIARELTGFVWDVARQITPLA